MRVMTKTGWIVFSMAAALVAGAGCKKEPAKSADPGPAPSGTPSGSGSAATTPEPGPTQPSGQPAAAGVDFTSPTKVTEAVFAAAASGKTDQLASLCDPTGEGDGDTKDICGLTAGSAKFGEFKEYFAKGKVTGETITGDAAEVAILFGPDGTKDETMKLVRRDGKWYLSSF
jgi:hypothetical protein